MSSLFFNIEALAQKLGLDHLPLEKQEEFLGRLEDMISGRINVAVLERLSPDEQDHFLDLINKNKEEDALFYIQNIVLDLPDLIHQVSAQTMDEFLKLKDEI